MAIEQGQSLKSISVLDSFLLSYLPKYPFQNDSKRFLVPSLSGYVIIVVIVNFYEFHSVDRINPVYKVYVSRCTKPYIRRKRCRHYEQTEIDNNDRSNNNSSCRTFVFGTDRNRAIICGHDDDDNRRRQWQQQQQQRQRKRRPATTATENSGPAEQHTRPAGSAKDDLTMHRDLPPNRASTTDAAAAKGMPLIRLLLPLPKMAEADRDSASRHESSTRI